MLWLISYWASMVGLMEGLTDKLLAVHIIQWESLNSHFELVDPNRTLVIANLQLTEVQEARRKLRGQLQGRIGHAGRLAAVEDREQEMADQMDGSLRCADEMHCSASQGVPLWLLVGTGVDVAIGLDFR